MALSHTDTDIQKVKINKFSTLADFTAAQTGGLIGPDEISFVDEPINADWNQSDSTKVDYIKNKPTIPDVTGKADKVSNATNGNFAALDSNGNLTDSGHKHSDYLTSQVNADWNALSGAAQILNKPTLATVATSGSYNDLSNKPTIPDAVSGTNDGTNWTSLTIGSVTKNIPSGGGGSGLFDYDFTHIANTTVSTSTTITFAEDTRGSQMVSTSADLAVTFAVENSSDNYLWIKNTGSSDIDITINDVTQGGMSASNIYVPDNGITIPTGKVCEIGIVVNTDGAFITSRSDLTL